jgi:hypothetical protein
MKIDIDWFFVHNEYGEKVENSPIDLLGIDPIPVLKFYNQNETSLIRRCPAYLDSLKNTYVICSPIDYEIQINREEKWVNVVTPKELPKELFSPRFEDEGNSEYCLFSIYFGRLIFVSRKKDVWMEVVDPFMEWERKNAMRIVSGRFNIHRWVRALEFAFEHKNRIDTIKIKRGEPLCYVRFTTKNSSDMIVLNRIEQNNNDMQDNKRNTYLKKFYPNKSLDFLYGLRDKYMAYKRKQK